MKIWIDGAGWNGEKSRFAIVVEGTHGWIRERSIHTIKRPKTNNEAEYLALIEALEYLDRNFMQFKDPVVEIYTDSQLVYHQVNGDWRINKPHLRELNKRVQSLLTKLRNLRMTIELKWLRRDENLAGQLLEKTR